MKLQYHVYQKHTMCYSYQSVFKTYSFLYNLWIIIIIINNKSTSPSFLYKGIVNKMQLSRLSLIENKDDV